MTESMVDCWICLHFQLRTCLALHMQAARIQPDAPIWNGLITLAGRAGQLQRAFQVLADMQTHACKPNARTYACLIDACSRTENMEMALKVYQVSASFVACDGPLLNNKLST